MQLYEKYIPCIADAYAWCLMGNHLACQAGFHFLVRIKDEEEIGFIPLKNESLPGHAATGRIVEKVINTPSAVKNPDGGLKTSL